MEQVLVDAWFDACQKGQLSTLEGMIAQGICPDVASSAGRRALPYACRMGDMALARTLLRLGANPNVFSFQDGQPVAAATRAGSLPLVQYLLDRGGKPDAIDQDGHWALLTAISSSPSIFSVLLGAGANPDICTNPGGNALMHCIRFGRIGALRALLVHGASVDAVDEEGRTALLYACASRFAGVPQMVQMLLDHGANPNHAAEHGWTPLMEAARTPRVDGCVVDMLLSAGADPFAVACKQGATLDALAVALRCNNPTAAARLAHAAGDKLDGQTQPCGTHQPWRRL